MTWWVIAQTSPFLIVLTPIDLEGQGHWRSTSISSAAPFSIGFWRIPRYTFGANLVILAQNVTCYCAEKARFSLIWVVLTSKWPWRSRSIYTIFNRVLEGPMIHNWCKFGDPSSKAWHVLAPKSPFFANLDLFNTQTTLKIKVNQHHFQ